MKKYYNSTASEFNKAFNSSEICIHFVYFSNYFLKYLSDALFYNSYRFADFSFSTPFLSVFPPLQLFISAIISLSFQV